VTIPFLDPTGDVERWEPPTLKSIQQIEGNPIVECTCGRLVNADMMRPLGDGFGCDACHETLFRTGELTREEFALSQGAPISVVDKARQIDAAESARSTLLEG
jgi:hypothetical protein